MNGLAIEKWNYSYFKWSTLPSVTVSYYIKILTSDLISFSPVPLLSLCLVVKYPYVLFVQPFLRALILSCTLHQPLCPMVTLCILSISSTTPLTTTFSLFNEHPQNPHPNNPITLSRPSNQWVCILCFHCPFYLHVLPFPLNCTSLNFMVFHFNHFFVYINSFVLLLLQHTHLVKPQFWLNQTLWQLIELQ